MKKKKVKLFQDTADVDLECFTKLFTCLYCICSETKTLWKNESDKSAGSFQSPVCCSVTSFIDSAFFLKLSQLGLAAGAFDQSHLLAHYRCMNAAVTSLTHSWYSCTAGHSSLTHRSWKPTGSTWALNSSFWFCWMAG